MIVGMDSLDVARWIHAGFNAVEALVWITAAVYVGRKAMKLPTRDQRVAVVASVFFVLFGISDVWEIFTGTWFRPLGLLILKIVCAAVLLACLGYYSRRRKRSRP